MSLHCASRPQWLASAPKLHRRNSIQLVVSFTVTIIARMQAKLLYNGDLCSFCRMCLPFQLQIQARFQMAALIFNIQRIRRLLAAAVWGANANATSRFNFARSNISTSAHAIVIQSRRCVVERRGCVVAQTEPHIGNACRHLIIGSPLDCT